MILYNYLFEGFLEAHKYARVTAVWSLTFPASFPAETAAEQIIQDPKEGPQASYINVTTRNVRFTLTLRRLNCVFIVVIALVIDALFMNHLVTSIILFGFMR